jgi:hypothetical protein
MIQMHEIIRQLTVNAEAIRAMLQSITPEQVQWKPNPETWCIQQVMEHVYNEERIDFRKHLKEMFSNPQLSWESYHHDEFIPVESCRQALDAFLLERKDSIARLNSLQSPDWNITAQAPFGPGSEVITLSAGDVLTSWVEHDYLHMRQMIELLHAWNEKQASPYSVQYGGGW